MRAVSYTFWLTYLPLTVYDARLGMLAVVLLMACGWYLRQRGAR